MSNETLNEQTDAQEVDPADATTTEAGAKAEDTAPGGGALTDEAKTADEKAVEPDWRDDWREKLAGGDQKELKRLQRFQSPDAVFKSLRALEAKLSSGEYRPVLAEGASDAEVAQYRKDMGIPETPEGYFDSLPDGLVIGDDDKPIVEVFAKKMHDLNATPETVREAIGWYFSEQEAQAQAQREAAAEKAKAWDDDLRAEWGGEYRMRVNALRGYLDTMPEELKSAVLGATYDGAALADRPEFLRWMASVVDDQNPAATVVPGAANAAQTIDAEIAEIESLMRSNPKAYDAKADRYRQLLDAREKLKARG